MEEGEQGGANHGAMSGGSKRSRWIEVGVSVVVVAAIFLGVIPKVASYSSVWATLSRLSSGQVALLVGMTFLNLFTYWPQMMAAMPGLTLLQAAVNNQTTTAVANTVPGGGAVAVGVGYAMFRSWGFTTGDIALLVLVTGVWNTLMKFGLPVVALAILALEGDVGGGLATAAVVGLVGLAVSVTLLALVLWKESLARAIGSRLGAIVSWILRVVRRPPVHGWDERAARFRSQSIRLVRRRWPALTVTTVVSHVGLYLVLLVSLRVLGVSGAEVTWAEALGVFALARLVSAIPITPGGLGVVELSYIGGLVLFGGPRPQVVAAVLVFRALTFAMQIPLGPIAYLVWRRRRRWMGDRPVGSRLNPRGDAGGRRASRRGSGAERSTATVGANAKRGAA